MATAAVHAGCSDIAGQSLDAVAMLTHADKHNFIGLVSLPFN